MSDSFQSAASSMLSEEEKTELEETGVDGDSDIELEARDATTSTERFKKAIEEEKPEEDKSVPPWVEIPTDLTIPKGKKVAFMRFLAKWTDRPDLGDRVIILWPLSVSDEKIARKRIIDSNEAVSELSKQMVRAIDGKRVDWTGMAASTKAKMGLIKAGADINAFWNEIGASCRQLIMNFYMRTHVLPEEEQLVFFASCIAVRTADGS